MRTKAISEQALQTVLGALTPPNRLACKIALATGFRISDVLLLKRSQMSTEKIAVQEQKTGKRRIVHLSKQLRQAAISQAGAIYIFPHRYTGLKPRTRQAVWKDLRRAQKLLRLPRGIGTHSMRKSYAKRLLEGGAPLSSIQKKLLHSSDTITALYALADEVHLRGE